MAVSPQGGEVGIFCWTRAAEYSPRSGALLELRERLQARQRTLREGLVEKQRLYEKLSSRQLRLKRDKRGFYRGEQGRVASALALLDEQRRVSAHLLSLYELALARITAQLELPPSASDPSPLGLRACLGELEGCELIHGEGELSLYRHSEIAKRRPQGGESPASG